MKTDLIKCKLNLLRLNEANKLQQPTRPPKPGYKWTYSDKSGWYQIVSQKEKPKKEPQEIKEEPKQKDEKPKGEFRISDEGVYGQIELLFKGNKDDLALKTIMSYIENTTLTDEEMLNLTRLSINSENMKQLINLLILTHSADKFSVEVLNRFDDYGFDCNKFDFSIKRLFQLYNDDNIAYSLQKEIHEKIKNYFKQEFDSEKLNILIEMIYENKEKTGIVQKSLRKEIVENIAKYNLEEAEKILNQEIEKIKDNTFNSFKIQDFAEVAENEKINEHIINEIINSDKLHETEKTNIFLDFNDSIDFKMSKNAVDSLINYGINLKDPYFVEHILSYQKKYSSKSVIKILNSFDLRENFSDSQKKDFLNIIENNDIKDLNLSDDNFYTVLRKFEETKNTEKILKIAEHHKDKISDWKENIFSAFSNIYTHVIDKSLAKKWFQENINFDEYIEINFKEDREHQRNLEDLRYCSYMFSNETNNKLINNFITRFNKIEKGKNDLKIDTIENIRGFVENTLEISNENIDSLLNLGLKENRHYNVIQNTLFTHQRLSSEQLNKLVDGMILNKNFDTLNLSSIKMFNDEEFAKKIFNKIAKAINFNLTYDEYFKSPLWTNINPQILQSTIKRYNEAINTKLPEKPLEGLVGKYAPIYDEKIIKKINPIIERKKIFNAHGEELVSDEDYNKIQREVSEKNYQLDDDSRYAYYIDKDGRKKQISLGKVLAKNPELLKKYNIVRQFEQKLNDDIEVVISTNPEDIARKSTGQNWVSCEKVGNSYGNPEGNCGWADDISANNAIGYIRRKGKNEWLGRTMIRWGEDKREINDKGIMDSFKPGQKLHWATNTKIDYLGKTEDGKYKLKFPDNNEIVEWNIDQMKLFDEYKILKDNPKYFKSNPNAIVEKYYGDEGFRDTLKNTLVKILRNNGFSGEEDYRGDIKMKTPYKYTGYVDSGDKRGDNIEYSMSERPDAEEIKKLKTIIRKIEKLILQTMKEKLELLKLREKLNHVII